MYIKGITGTNGEYAALGNSSSAETSPFPTRLASETIRFARFDMLVAFLWCVCGRPSTNYVSGRILTRVDFSPFFVYAKKIPSSSEK